MSSKRNCTALMINLMTLDTDDAPIKKTGYTTVGKLHQEDGTAVFNATKNVSIAFASTFAKVPLIQLTMASSGTIPAYKSVVTTTGFTIKFQNAWTGDCDWTATERK